VVLLVAGIAGATFVVSYAGVRDLAIGAGVPWRLARLYPAILDGVLVVAGAAAFVLRDDTSVFRRLYAWFCTALLVGVIGTADAIHAMGVHLPSRPTEGTIAALPWAVVMLGFSLWLTMLRYARSHVGSAAPAATPAPAPEAPVRGEPADGAAAGRAAAGRAAAPAGGGGTAAPAGGGEAPVAPVLPFARAASADPASWAGPSVASPSVAAPAGAGPSGREERVPEEDEDEDAGLDLALGLVHSIDDDAEEAYDLDDAAADDVATDTGSDEVSHRVDSPADSSVGDAEDSAPPSEDAAVDTRPVAASGEETPDEDVSDEAGTEDDEPVQSPKLYRVRSTPVPPAE
jgi:hypothetical protein